MYLRRILRFPLVLSMLAVVSAGSSHAGPGSSQVKSTTGSLLVHVSFLEILEEKRTAVPLDHTFAVGDQLRIEVTPNRTGFLYLFSRGKDGKRVRLWPPGEAMVGVREGQTIAVPEQGSFRVEGNAGEDTIEFLFTVSPLADPLATAESQTGSRIRQIRLREIKLDRATLSDPGSSFEADLDDRGVAVLELKVKHR